MRQRFGQDDRASKLIELRFPRQALNCAVPVGLDDYTIWWRQLGLEFRQPCSQSAPATIALRCCLYTERAGQLAQLFRPAAGKRIAAERSPVLRSEISVLTERLAGLLHQGLFPTSDP